MANVKSLVISKLRYVGPLDISSAFKRISRTNIAENECFQSSCDVNHCKAINQSLRSDGISDHK